MDKVIFFDIDGTLTETISGEPFKQHPKDIQLISGVERGIRTVQRKGYKLFGISNQGGIAAGKKIADDMVEEMQFTLGLIPQLEVITTCPDYEGNVIYEITEREHNLFSRNEFFAPAPNPELALRYSPFRKPSPGMIEWIVDRWNLKGEDFWVIGDRKEDHQAAEAAHLRFLAAGDFHEWNYRADQLIVDHPLPNLIDR